MHIGIGDCYLIKDDLPDFETCANYLDSWRKTGAYPYDVKKVGSMCVLPIELELMYCKFLTNYGKLYTRETDNYRAAKKAARNIIRNFIQMHGPIGKLVILPDYLEKNNDNIYEISNHPN
jgi:hypothetical protein